MSLPINYYFDGRILVPGNRNRFLNTADPKHLNDIISQILLNTAPGANQLPLIIQNGLSDTYISGTGTQIEWGGSLIKDTTINANSLYNVKMLGLSGYTLISDTGDIFIQTPNANNIDIDSGQVLTLMALNSLEVKTPLFASKADGTLLQKTNSSGAVEYTAYTFPLSDGTSGQVLVTNGAGVLTFQDGILGADNGNTVVSGEVFWGGNLLQNTTINASNLYDINFDQVSSFSVQNTATIALLGSSTTIQGSTLFHLITTSVDGVSVPNGAILQLLDNSTGESDFTAYSLPNTAANNTGDVLVASATDTLDWSKRWQSLTREIAQQTIEMSTITGTDNSNAFIPIGPDLDGWILNSVTICAHDVGGAPVVIDFDIQTSAVGGVISNTFNGTTTTYTPGTPPTVSTNDVVSIGCPSGGTDIFGMSITFTFRSS